MHWTHRYHKKVNCLPHRLLRAEFFKQQRRIHRNTKGHKWIDYRAVYKYKHMRRWLPWICLQSNGLLAREGASIHELDKLGSNL